MPTSRALDERKDHRSKADAEARRCDRAAARRRALLADAPSAAAQAGHFALIEPLRAEALGDHALTVESCDNREQDLRKWLQERIDAEDKKLARLREKIVKAMAEYNEAYKLDTQEVDASVDAAGEYRAMLDRLARRRPAALRARFKELLNENTIREVANFQSQLAPRARDDQGAHRAHQRLADADRLQPGPLHRARSAARDRRRHPRLPDRAARLHRGCASPARTMRSIRRPSSCRSSASSSAFAAARARPSMDRRWTRQGHRRAQLVRLRCQRALARGSRANTSTTPIRAASRAGRRKSSPTPSWPRASPTSSASNGARCARARSASSSSTRPSAAARTNRRSTACGSFKQLNLQLLIVTPLQKIHIIEPFVASVGFVHNEDGSASKLRNLGIEEYRAERDAQRAPVAE